MIPTSWTTPPDVSDEDSIATVKISHIGLFWNRDLVQHYAFPDFSDIFRCFARQEHDCSSAVHPLPHCIIQLTHIQKVVTKEQGPVYHTNPFLPSQSYRLRPDVWTFHIFAWTKTCPSDLYKQDVAFVRIDCSWQLHTNYLDCKSANGCNILLNMLLL